MHARTGVCTSVLQRRGISVQSQEGTIRFSKRLRQEDDQDAVEYVLLAVLISLAITAGISLLSASIDQSYNDAAACIAHPTQRNRSHELSGGTGQPGNNTGKGNGPPTNPCP